MSLVSNSKCIHQFRMLQNFVHKVKNTKWTSILSWSQQYQMQNFPTTFGAVFGSVVKPIYVYIIFCHKKLKKNRLITIWKVDDSHNQNFVTHIDLIQKVNIPEHCTVTDIPVYSTWCSDNPDVFMNDRPKDCLTCQVWWSWIQVLWLARTEETFGLVSFESIFVHLEIISNGRPIKVLNDNIDISKSSALKRTKNFTCEILKIDLMLLLEMSSVV